jgi:hypothetical protein
MWWVSTSEPSTGISSSPFCPGSDDVVCAALVGGVVDLDSPAHQALLLMLGAESRREVVRARQRTLAAMRAQTCLQGRFLDGRPPYGYRLVDAGPHPNRAHARWGRQAHQLSPDPSAAPWVRWIFEQRAAGRSMAGIARKLNERSVPWPPTSCATGTGPARRGSCGRSPVFWPTLATPGARTYLLAGLLVCGTCGRQMDSHWTNQRAGYRCRHGHTSARHRPASHPKNVYIRQDHLLASLRHRLPTTPTSTTRTSPTTSDPPE